MRLLPVRSAHQKVHVRLLVRVEQIFLFCSLATSLLEEQRFDCNQIWTIYHH
jgi:hypothetical protein